MRSLLIALMLCSLACADASVIDSTDPDAGPTGSVCVPASQLCNGSILMICQTDGTGYSTISCRAGCENDQCVSSKCQNNTKRCVDDKLAEHCDAEGNSQLFLCDHLCLNGDCQAIECTGGLTFCEPGGNKLLLCSPDGLDITEVEACSYGCNPATAQCMDPACSAGELRCAVLNPLEIQQCNEALTGFEATSITCSESCIDGVCHVSACQPGEQQCGVEWVETCMSDGAAFKPTESCDWGCLQNNAGQAVCAKCLPGAYRCEGLNIQYCSDPFFPWETLKACNSIDTCVQASCVKQLSLNDGNTSDQNRMLLTQALADCWITMTAGGPEKDDCRNIVTVGLSYDIPKSELENWFCEGYDEGSINADNLGGAAHLDAAVEIMGCGWLNLSDLTFETIGKKITGGLNGVECIAYESDELVVALCDGL